MISPQPDVPLPTAVEELTAYLDGELDAAGRTRVEDRLAKDSAYRRELERLERAWGLLDHLSPATVEESFSRSTMAMVAVAADEERAGEQAKLPRVRRRWGILVAAAVIVGGLAGVAVGHRVWPDPNDQLLRDLPVLEEFDYYRHADSLGFLQQLEHKGVFPEEPDHPVSGGDWQPRLQQITAMAPDVAERVTHNQPKFALVSPEQQAQLRLLADEMERDPQRELLHQVMIRYHDWLKKLPAVQRAELIELPADERVAKIEQLRAEQQKLIHAESTAGEPLTPADLDQIVLWIEKFAWKHQEALLMELPDERRHQIEQLDPAKRRRAILWVVGQRWRNGQAGGLPPIEAKDIAELEGKLSPAASERLQKAGTLHDQRVLVRHWSQAAVRHRMETVGANRTLPTALRLELERFFEHDLTGEQRDQLMAMPTDRMQRELRRLYFLQPGHAAMEGASSEKAGGDAVASDANSQPPASGGKKKADKGGAGASDSQKNKRRLHKAARAAAAAAASQTPPSEKPAAP